MAGTNSILLIISLTILITLICIAAIDLNTKTIHRKLLYILLLGSAAAIYLDNDKSVADSMAAMAVMFLLLSLLYIVSRKSIGWGDVELCTCTAAFLGMERALAMLILSILICGMFAAALMLIRKSGRHNEIPFAPFVAAATAVVVLL